MNGGAPRRTRPDTAKKARRKTGFTRGRERKIELIFSGNSLK
jgi:hypothetical protein